MMRSVLSILIAAALSLALFLPSTVSAQPQGLGAQPSSLPPSPTATAIPRFERITGPGPMFASANSQWPGRDMEHFNYVAHEFLVSGTADGAPYTTRVVIRHPEDLERFSGLVLAEAMHPVGSAHGFEYNSVYLMDSGHIAVEIGVAGTQGYAAFNADRYASVSVAPNQGSLILAQVGALMKSDTGPLGELEIRKMILWGTSASSFILTSYFPTHAVMRTADMQHIYDGFMPTSNGSTIQPVDVPMIQIPTQHEYDSVATAVQDGDEPGSQFRVYEFVGMGHLDTRNDGRLGPNDCVHPLSRYPTEAYMSVALNHLLRWVDEGIVPPRAPRVVLDLFVDNDGSLMALDEHGNATGGIRNPYVDVPVAKYTARNQSTSAPAAPGANGGGFDMTAIVCNLSAYITPKSRDELRQLYNSKREYLRAFEARLRELEIEGWSLPVYHDLIMQDARAVQF